MELIKKTPLTRLKNLVDKVYEDNLFLLSSSVSYYSALAIAPFLLILLAVASLIGEDVQTKVINLCTDFSPEMGTMTRIIFDNVNEGVDIGSISGILGLVIILWTASLVFLQLRYSFDVIYRHHNPLTPISLTSFLKERIFAMGVVIISGIFLIVSASLPGLVAYFLKDHSNLLLYRFFAFLLNIFTYIITFWLIQFYAPSKKPRKRDALKMSILSSVFFILGNMVLARYFSNIASSSIYGAAASLLVFLIWVFYSSFTIFLSAEIFLFYQSSKKAKV